METLFARIDSLLTRKDRVIVAIDGSCASGKTTLAAALAEKYRCNVFHMDDFFLRPEQRTEERFAEPGGNVDYERFKEEVLLPLLDGGSFSWRPFLCQTMTIGEPVHVSPEKLTIIEGSYSLHPSFGDYADLKVFLQISPELRRERILARPAFLHENFFTRWIPMEQLYFDTFSVAGKCDLILDAGDLLA
ncbi:MAG: uridine kinase [Oscillospiraceae bacterium]|nr:uridine kinase [Oscillospiraceae bacterium]